MRFGLGLFVVLFALNGARASAIGFDLSSSMDDANENEIQNEKAKNTIFYNESQDCKDGLCRQNKNYAKIGVEDYSQKNPWFKFYVGVDINWHAIRFGGGASELSGEDPSAMHSFNFWRRFQNLDVYGGARLHRFFGAEIGYMHLGNVDAKNGKKMNLDGMFISAMGHTPHLDLAEMFSLEGYASAGGAMIFDTTNGGKPFLSGKFGCGILAKIYGTLAVNAGIDYYYPTGSFSKKGFMTIKTGVNVYLSI